jgi:hypothetical protein
MNSEPKTSSSLTPFLTCLPLALVLAFAAPTPALALGDWVGVEGSIWRNNQDGQASIDGDFFTGTTFDFQDTLDLEKSDSSKMGRVWFKLGKTRLVFDYLDSSRDGSKTLTQSFFFDDTPYAASEDVDSRLSLKLLQAQMRFTLADLKIVDVGVGFGLNQAQVNMVLDNGLPGGRSELDEKIPYPTLAAAVTIKPFPGFHIRAEANGLNANISGTRVSVLDTRLQVEMYIAHVLGFFAGYRNYRFDAVDEDFGSIENTFKGPYAGIGLKF